MRALSIQQPWSWLITHGYKDIENRDWTTPYRGLILIHAGKKLDTAILQTLEWRNRHLAMDEHWKEPWGRMPPENTGFQVGGIVGYATLQEVVTQSESPWFVGRYGFVLTNCYTLPFLPLRGQLGLFEVPGEVEEQVSVLL